MRLEKPNSNAREINPLPNSTRAVAGLAYRHFWHQKQKDPSQGRQSLNSRRRADGVMIVLRGGSQSDGRLAR